METLSDLSGCRLLWLLTLVLYAVPKICGLCPVHIRSKPREGKLQARGTTKMAIKYSLTAVFLFFNSLCPNFWIPTGMEDCNNFYGIINYLIINDKRKLLYSKLSYGFMNLLK
jgi:hypothetical protein